jgi:ribosomal protein L28
MPRIWQVGFTPCKLWTSSGGKTPHVTLYTAILREINDQGMNACVVKTERG